METIKIAHLYYDLMNLYGEHGNVLALQKHLEAHKIKPIIHYLSIEDKIDFEKYDIFYIGSGSNPSLELVRENILKYKNDIKTALKNKKFFIVTGNAINLFGKSYNDLKENSLETLNIFDHETFETDFRIVGEQVYKFPKIEEEIIGFQNRNTVLKFVKEKHLFEVINGTGYVPKSIVEGIKKNNFYGTYLLGPILIRNPFFTEYLVEQIIKQKNIAYEFYKDELETKAYDEYKKNMLKENN
mgnify:CR=1 FL=1